MFLLLRLQLCSQHHVPVFTKFKVFEAKRESDLSDWVVPVSCSSSSFPASSPLPPAANSKTLSGLLEFDSKTAAVETLTVLNHQQIRTSRFHKLMRQFGGGF